MGRRAAPYTDVPDWVGLADGVDPAAHSLYGKLKMHLHVKRGDTTCWPGMHALAQMMGMPDEDKLPPLLAQLAAIGAVDILLSNTMPRHNVYVVNDEPADGYTGPRTLAEWYERHRPAIEVRKQAAKLKRDRSRARAKAHAAGQVCGIERCTRPACQQDHHDNSRPCGVPRCPRSGCAAAAPRRGKKAQVTPDTPVLGSQDETDIDGAPDTPNLGSLDTPNLGVEQPTTSWVVVAVPEEEQQGGTLPPLTPLRPQEPPTSALGNEQPSQTDHIPTKPPQAPNGEVRPRTREQDSAAPVNDPGSDVLPADTARALARRYAASGGPRSPRSPETTLPRVPRTPGAPRGAQVISGAPASVGAPTDGGPYPRSTGSR